MALAKRRLFPSHRIMAANNWKRPGCGSLQISLGRRGKFPLLVLYYFSRLKELGEEGPVHGLFFSVFLSSPGKMFCTDHFNFYGMRKWSFNQKISVFARFLAEHILTPHPLWQNLWLSRWWRTFARSSRLLHENYIHIPIPDKWKSIRWTGKHTGKVLRVDFYQLTNYAARVIR